MQVNVPLVTWIIDSITYKLHDVWMDGEQCQSVLTEWSSCLFIKILDADYESMKNDWWSDAQGDWQLHMN